jgi:hypothetical protein
MVKFLRLISKSSHTMKKLHILLFALIAIFVLSACDGTASGSNDDSIADQNAETENVDVDRTSSTEGRVEVDTDGDLKVDATIEVNADVVTATVEYDAPVGVSATEYCVPGSTYVYESEEGSSNSIVVGLEQYKGRELCKATSQTKIESPMGQITSDTVYYFDNTYNEFYVIVTTSGGPMPAPQVNEVHIVNGKAQ